MPFETPAFVCLPWVSIPHLEYVEGNQVKIRETKIPIGQSYRDKVNEVLR